MLNVVMSRFVLNVIMSRFVLNVVMSRLRFFRISGHLYSKCITTSSLAVIFVANAIRNLCSVQISLPVTS